MQDNNTLLDAVERYVRGEMLPEERRFFEHVRASNPEVDQLVIEHTLFLKQFTQYGETARLKAKLHDVHEQLSETGEIGEGRPALVVALWRKYKRVVFVAASIAGITALMISGLVSILSPKVSPDEVDYLKGVVNGQNIKINNIAKAVNSPKETQVFEGFGTGFLIDGKGYLITNAHVVRNAHEIDVQNTLGNYHARLIRLDPEADLALLKIDDTLYHAFSGLPYGISKSDGDVGEDLFTLGYPRPEIVYNKGYLSASTGFQDDTTAFQLTIAANPGNSGTPVFNTDGEVIGVVNSVQHNAQGMVFAVRARNIFRAVDSIKADSTLQSVDSTLVHLHVPQTSALKGVDRRMQIKRIEDYVFMVKIK
jgi:S1-C subfamily serine protease